MADLIMLIGAPASGKSTIAEALTRQLGLVTLSSDTIREELYGDESVQGNARQVFAHLHSRTRKMLAKGYTVVYDATNVNARDRARTLRALCDSADRIIAVVVECSLTDSLARNASRSRHVPEAVILRMRESMAKSTPHMGEGFSKIVRVDTSSMTVRSAVRAIEKALK